MYLDSFVEKKKSIFLFSVFAHHVVQWRFWSTILKLFYLRCTFRALALRQSEFKCTCGWRSSLTIDCRVVNCVQSCDREREGKEYVKRTMHLLSIKCKPGRTRRIAIDVLNLTYKLTSRQNRINSWRSISIRVKINLTRCETKYLNSLKKTKWNSKYSALKKNEHNSYKLQTSYCVTVFARGFQTFCLA